MSLEVSSEVPFGNVADVEITTENGLPSIRFRAHPHGGPECLWFCFRVTWRGTEANAPEKIRLVLKDPHNMLGGGRPENFRPVFRLSGEDWERTGAGELVSLPDGRNEVAWEVSGAKPDLDFAFCYPYGMDDVGRMVRATKGYWNVDVIGVSPAGRQLVRLSNGPGEEGSERPGIYLTARQHSGETPGSWLLDGFLRHMATLGDEAPLIWAIPLTNIDGVEQGDYGKDNFPYDLNRAWDGPPMRHEVLVFQHDIRRWANRCKPALMIDSHAPGGSETGGVYVYLPSPKTFPDQHKTAKEWSDVAAETLGSDYANPEFGKVAEYRSRWETPTFTAFGCGQIKTTTLSFETPYAMVGETVLTRERYREAGERVAQAAANWINDK